ncbi:MAG: glycosyltransferase family 39 protein [Acidimicrobiales bacterium]
MDQADAPGTTTVDEVPADDRRTDEARPAPDPVDGANDDGHPRPTPTQRAAHVGRTYWPLALVFLLALGVRLWSVYAGMPECTPAQAANRTVLTECYAVGGDAYHYQDLAQHIADGKGFTVLSYATFTDVDVADHPPAYPLFLAALDTLGLTEMNQHRLVMSFVGALAAAMVGLVGWRVMGRATGVVAGVIAATYAGYWMSEAYYMSESLFVLFVAFALLAAYRFWRSPSWTNALLAGFTGGLAWLTRGEAALVLGFTMLGFLAFSRREAFWKRVKLGVVACAVCIGMMVPWVAYNLYRFPEPIYIASTGTAFALNSCDEVWYGDGTGFYSFGCLARTTTEVQAEDGEVTDAGLRRKATEYQRANLGRYPAVVAIRIGRLFGVYAVGDTFDRNWAAEGRRPDWVRAQVVYYYGFLVLGAVGLVVLRRRRVPITPLVAPLLATMATVAGTFAIFRYRLTADTALIVAGAAGLVAVVQWGVRSLRGDDPAPPPDGGVGEVPATVATASTSRSIVEPDRPGAAVPEGSTAGPAKRLPSLDELLVAGPHRSDEGGEVSPGGAAASREP